MTTNTTALRRIRWIMDCLDAEDDENVRADLIEEGIECADANGAQVAAEWKAYR